ncbi:glycosyltransferase family 25 protein [Ruegeria sp.]|uniref:glycosyltransferase family 25 protein n=1 Tax=Ruegeria sp. TaxID=1879320 RepID=UPI003B5C3FDE
MTSYPILIISLADATDRQQAISEKLDALGLDYSFFTAIDGRNGLPSNYEPLIDRELADKRVRRLMTDGEFACALSHRAIYQHVIDQNLPGAVILEDDAQIQPEFKTFVDEKGFLLAPMLLLDYSRVPVMRGSRKDAGRIGATYRIASNPVLATGYSVSKQAAADLLAGTTPVSCYADWPVDLYRIGARAVSPRPVHHVQPDAAQSSLQTDRESFDAHRRKKPLSRYMKAMYWRNRFAVRLDP